jgi:hypothetical protein
MGSDKLIGCHLSLCLSVPAQIPNSNIKNHILRVEEPVKINNINTRNINTLAIKVSLARALQFSM